MGAFLRMEIFPSDMHRCIDFYTRVLRFQLLRHEKNYAYLQRDGIFIGMVPDVSLQPGVVVKREDRKPPHGVEIVVEVDDVELERELVVRAGWELEADLKEQDWGLKDFRVCDPDGFYLRVTGGGQRNMKEV